MTPRGYRLARRLGQIVRNQCVVEFVLNRRRLDRPGGFVLAATHVSHLEPAIVSCHARRTIHWIARVEFFRHRLAGAALRFVGALPLHREGVPARTIRRAIALAAAGEVVGIFPEGGVKTGGDAVFRGGPMRRGACVIAIRAGVPIVPCVVLGTERLNRVGPWLPFKRARAWVAYGHAIELPPTSMHRRAARIDMARRLQAEFVRLYRELLDRSGLADDEVP